MIIAAGLTPAWQQILSFSQLQLGEVNRAATATACASGKVLNVASAVHHLGGIVETLCPIGGLTGDQVRSDFQQLGIPATWIETAEPTRVCTTLLDTATGQTTELVENSRPLTTAELDRYVAAYTTAVARAERVVLSGSLPQATPRDFYERLLSVTRSRVLLDARGPELVACLPHRPWLVKPNREELGQTVGRPLESKDDIVAALRALVQAGAQHVIMSDGHRALYAASPQGIEEFAPLTVPAVNPIGCGDCLAAGLAVAASEGRKWTEVVEFGIAAAAENATHLLPARFSRQAVEERIRPPSAPLS